MTKFRDGSESWIPLANLKEYNPLEIAEYSIRNRLEKEPVFAWWVPHVINKRNKIISAVTNRGRINNMKYGMEIPTSTTDAYDKDRENGNTVWRDAIKREMENVSVAFEILEDGKIPSAAHKKVPFHIIYDIKMDFTSKARFLEEGCRTPNSVTSTYTGA